MIRDAARAIALIVRLSFRVDTARSIAMIGCNLADSATPLRALALGAAITAIAAGDTVEAIVGCVLVGLLSLGFGIGNLQWARLSQTVSEKATLEMDRELMRLTDEIPSLVPFEVPEYQNRLELVKNASGTIGGGVRTLTAGLVTIVKLALTLFVLAALHPALLVLPLFALPSVWAAGVGSRLRAKAEEDTAESTRLAAHLFNLPTTADSAKELRVFGLHDAISKAHDNEWRAILRTRRRAQFKSTALGTVAWAIFGIGFVAGITLVARNVIAGNGAPGDVAAALLVGSELTLNVSVTAGFFGSVGGEIRRMGHYLWLLDYSGEQARRRSTGVPAPEKLTAGIQLEGVSFRYPGRDTDVLTGVDLSLPAGSTVALVGDNGAGKTTLVKLLCGFYDPTEGRITVDGAALDQIDPVEWRRKLSGAFQDYAMFEFVAREVVGVGDVPRIEDEAAVAAALDRAGGAEIPATLEKGLETQLGRSFGGRELSGGQWQKLALGRSMMRETPLLLILDEPTASLDAETEHALFERYAGAARDVAASAGAITVLVSHRFSTVRMADLIVVLDGGSIREFGSHEHLMARGGLYAELFAIQARGYTS